MLKKTIGEWEDEHQQQWPNNYETALKYKDEGIRGWDCEKEYQEECRSPVIDYLKIHCLEMPSDELTYRLGHLPAYTSNCLAPEITFVCQEAYQVVSEHYALVFQPVDHGGIWFNFEIDTLYLERDSFPCYPDDTSFWFSIIDELEQAGSPLDFPILCQNVEHVALVMREDDEWQDRHELWALSVMGYFKHLQTFTFVLRHHKINASDTTPVSFIEPIDVESVLHQDDRLTHIEVPLDFKILESFEMDRLDSCLKGVYGSPPNFPDIPKFEEKVAITAAMLDNLKR
ncbi:uncharacterized protein PAC_12924 [Phialocephala subalpina]|uniref:Uncharacterized protein n=1 Tax=Phialocephala subalpina TaxID=576137 RepID=A0A1L7XDI6_9HELO|nr:uncharacterized protein PAC_12924 [Phialocephala subalpina]